MVKPKHLPLDDPHRDFSAEIERGEWVPASQADKAAIIAAARRNIARRAVHGGVRPGAGRKALGKVRLQTQVHAETLEKIRRAAHGTRGIGRVIDKLAAAL